MQLLALWFSAAEPNDADQERIDKLNASMREPVTALVEILRSLGSAERLLLLDTATQTVAKLDADAFRKFVDDCQRTGLAGDPDNFFRWAWHHMVRQGIRARCEEQAKPRSEEQAKPRYGSIEPVLGPCEVMLSTLAYAGAHGPMANFALQRAVSKLGHDLTLRNEDDCTLEALDLALECLTELSARCCRDVLLACGAVVSSDHEVDEDEAYLLRGIFSVLDYPHARLLPGQPVAPGA